jgi:Tfp pilus assembly PilM family ATPase
MAKASKINLVRLRSRNQITLPAVLMESLSLEEGDYLAAVVDDDGTVRLRPATMVTAGTPEAEKAILRAEADLRAGRSEKFENVPAFVEEMASSHKEELAQLDEARTTMLVQVAPNSMSASVQRENEPIFARTVGAGSENSSREDLVREVRKTIELFRSTAGAITIGEVFLSAGNPPLEGFAELLRTELKMRVEELSPIRQTESIALGANRFFPSKDLLEVNVGKFLLSPKNSLTR